MQTANIADRELGVGRAETTCTTSQITSSTCRREMRTRQQVQPTQKRYCKKRQRTQYDGYKFMILVGTVYLSLVVKDHQYRAALVDPRDTTTETLRRQLSTETMTTPETTNTSTRQENVKGYLSHHSCELIYEFPLAEQCTFATTCNDGEGIFLGHLIYCSAQEEGSTTINLSPHTILCLVCGPLALVLVLLFRVLGSTAEEFFSPGLEMFSIKLGLPERFAGVTLLALGNGAPDVASTVNAIRNDQKRGYRLALGELLGSSMVASTLIVGMVAFVSPTPVPCRGAFVRDVVMFITTMILVFRAFNDETIDPKEIRNFIGFYLAYVVLVLGADIYHRMTSAASTAAAGLDNQRLTPYREIQDSKDKESGKLQTTETTFLIENTSAIADKRTENNGAMLQRLVGFLTNYDDDENDESQTGNHENQAAGDKQGIAEIHPGRPRSARRGSSGWGERDEAGGEPLMVFHPHHGGMVNLKVITANGIGHLISLDEYDRDHHDWILGAATELKSYFRDFFDSIYGINSEYNRFDKALMTLELPFTMIRMFTIPVPCDGYYCRPLLALSVALSPIWLCIYFYDQFEVNILEQRTVIKLAVFGIPLLISLICLRLAPRGNVPPGPLIAAPTTMIGFAVSATYLDFIGDKLVILLTFFGVVCHIPSSIMGITVLAWGNASQDLIANMTVARKDLSTMAITASLAGPVFNILVGLGISYAPYVSRNQVISVQLDNVLRSSFMFCVLNGLLMIAAGIWFGHGTIPRNYGYVAAVVYAVYAVVSLTI